MSTKITEQYYPTTPTDWRNWLHKYHANKSGVWVIYYKKATQKPTITWSEAVDAALCYGWIDSIKKTINSEKYMQYFSPRKNTSIWSKINKEKIEKLTKAGLMSDAGLAAIDIAKQNGSWSMYDDVENLILPPRLKLAFENNNDAHDYYQNLSKSKKKMILYWVISAKREATVSKRIADIIESCKVHTLPKQLN